MKSSSHLCNEHKLSVVSPAKPTAQTAFGTAGLVFDVFPNAKSRDFIGVCVDSLLQCIEYGPARLFIRLGFENSLGGKQLGIVTVARLAEALHQFTKMR